jgi:hypothetical protein
VIFFWILDQALEAETGLDMPARWASFL